MGGMSEPLLAENCPLTAHLEGSIPTGAVPTLSSTGQFHHFHYLHVPDVILRQPPVDGWTTISSLMIPDLGIDDFFFQSAEVRKQFHCHQVFIGHDQLLSIGQGRETEVIAYIRTRRGPTRNHSFIFNEGGVASHIGFERRKQEARNVARNRRLRRQRLQCDVRDHRGVTVFNSRSERTVIQIAELERLKGY